MGGMSKSIARHACKSALLALTSQDLSRLQLKAEAITHFDHLGAAEAIWKRNTDILLPFKLKGKRLQTVT